MLAYGIVYWAMRLSLHSVTSAVLYIGYLLLLALFDFLITGTSSSVPAVHFPRPLPFPIPPTIRPSHAFSMVSPPPHIQIVGVMNGRAGPCVLLFFLLCPLVDARKCDHMN